MINPFPDPRLIFALIMIPARYMIIAGLFYYLFYKYKPHKWAYLKIQEKTPTDQQIKTEIIYSLITIFIFSLVTIFIFGLDHNGYTYMYNEIDNYGVPYYIFSTILLIVIHDIYFFITHKMMHHRKIYPIVHKIHHLSTNPSPWAAFSFHPIEAIVQIAWIPIVVMVLPVHHSSILIWSIFMMVFNVAGHLGYEIFPKRFLDYKIGKIFFTSTFHNIHHSKNNCNYGLYFIIWDRLLKTFHPDYQKIYNRIKLNIS